MNRIIMYKIGFAFAVGGGQIGGMIGFTAGLMNGIMDGYSSIEDDNYKSCSRIVLLTIVSANVILQPVICGVAGAVVGATAPISVPILYGANKIYNTEQFKRFTQNTN